VNKPADKQQPILEAAERLFSARGFKGTSVRDIAQEAGVNLAMISYYFGSKEGLLEALFIKRMSEGRVVLQGLLDDGTLEPLAKVETLIDGYVDRVLDNGAFQRIYLWMQLAEETNNVTQMLSEQKKQNRRLMRALIHEGQDKKVFTTDVDIDMLITTLFGTIYQAVSGLQHMRALLQEEGKSAEEYESTLRKNLKTHLKKLFKAILTYDVK
jgi:AcrR family transcriptional regulator